MVVCILSLTLPLGAKIVLLLLIELSAVVDLQKVAVFEMVVHKLEGKMVYLLVGLSVLVYDDVFMKLVEERELFLRLKLLVGQLLLALESF